MTGRIFSAAELAVVSGVSVLKMEMFLREFEAVGIVQRRGDRWEATERGLRISFGLSLAAPEEAEAA